jgi:hypothetical protein
MQRREERRRNGTEMTGNLIGEYAETEQERRRE